MHIKLQSKQSNEFIFTLCSALTKKTDNKEFKEVISPTYVDITNNLENNILKREKDYEKLKVILSKNP